MEPGKNLRLELGQRFEIKSPGHRNSVADGKRARIDDADNISWISEIERGSFSCHHPMRARKADFFSQPMMLDDEIPFKASRTDPDKGHAVAMASVHIGLEFEHIAAKGGFTGSISISVPSSRVGHTAMGAGSQMDKGIKKGLDPEIGKGRGKKYGGHFA